ncbi:MAG: hypothetical protein KIH08_11395 [Candidatus Freyarchaeota archaeon]|nr:hypothetical protein [Candidatus Jordarchaeia archaeon]MBS7270213.1 hypothetical protein [Candidatus Jordarchaeia archaeon]MBS7279826.1 hypothetical protein [Candidatus Jordarchaeia archaeon]
MNSTKDISDVTYFVNLINCNERLEEFEGQHLTPPATRNRGFLANRFIKIVYLYAYQLLGGRRLKNFRM